MILDHKGEPIQSKAQVKNSPYIDAVLGGRLGNNKHAGVDVNYTSSMRQVDVYTCNRILSETIASLPVYVYSIDGELKTKVSRGHRFHKLFTERPCEQSTMQEFVETTISNLSLFGNAYAYKVMVGGTISQLVPFRYPNNVNVDMNAEGRVYYTYTRNDRTGGDQVFPQEEVMHIKLFSPDGIKGFSPIQQAGEAIGLGIANQRYSAKTYENSAMMSGIVSLGNDSGDTLDDEQYARLQDSYKDFQGVNQAGKILIMEGGAKYQSMSMSHQDAQVMELANFSREQIASIFRVPVHMLNDTSAQTYSNVENNNLQFLRHALLPLIRKIETALTEMLPDNYVVEFDTNEYLRGDSLSLVQVMDGLAKLGAISVNEIRQKFGMNPEEGADVFQVATNNAEFGTWEEAAEIRQELRDQTNMAAETTQMAADQQMVMNEAEMNAPKPKGPANDN
ncbi:MAG: phage portal protein [Robiginitomaculum sp.]|nr:MAG: phage portal protein [Robiginitomaculum sp.]